MIPVDRRKYDSSASNSGAEMTLHLSTGEEDGDAQL